jgi:hypothetical protein
MPAGGPIAGVLISEFIGKGAHIRPSRAFLSRLPQQICRVQHCHRPYGPPIFAIVENPFAPRAGNPFSDPQERLARRCAQTNQDFGICELDLTLDEGQALLRLLWRRGSISRGAPRNDVGDIDLPSIESDRCKHAIEQLSGPSHEWTTNSILIAARRLAHQHYARAWLAIIEHKLRGHFLQGATLKALHI